MKKSANEPLGYCGAKSKRSGEPCKKTPMSNGRCYFHGGASTGPKTKKGLEMSKKANWKHGLYSREFKEEMKAMKSLMTDSKNFLKIITD